MNITVIQWSQQKVCLEMRPNKIRLKKYVTDLLTEKNTEHVIFEPKKYIAHPLYVYFQYLPWGQSATGQGKTWTEHRIIHSETRKNLNEEWWNDGSEVDKMLMKNSHF